MICDWDVQTFDWWAAQLKREARDGKEARSGLKVCFLQSFYYRNACHRGAGD